MHEPTEQAAGLALRQFLTWVAACPRTYADTMEAWRSTCPRLSVWEDALGDGLVRIDTDGRSAMSGSRVVLTSRGQALLDHGCS
ncbi:hypothetical protein [Limobrevibacterium gyesilva]|uniref:Uncharacterized protein n=1 Tax=Limobrevibacterium gyesilva TaxID=2991712 RepID=A0AA42CFJ8_9PROT|nr:hypothetical protein [Limobrevibacterium gyesilva]MCW3477243.1 hypothetical protein [Limobrevibacterium gyesilva]